MGDILARLGFDDARLVAGLVGGWRALFGAIRPDLVISEFAPFMLCALRGLAPTIAAGTGFDVPPSNLPRFPALSGAAAAHDELATLEAANKGLRDAGAQPIAALPEAFAASREIAGTFAEIDPYAGHRTGPLTMPSMGQMPALAPEGGEEVFVYAPELLSPDAKLWDGLQRSGLPVRVHIPTVPPAYLEQLRRRGFAVEPQPLAFEEIARRSRLLVSHGGHGFLCAALYAGLPHVVCHYDLEKYIHAMAVVRLGLGGHVPLFSIDPDAFAQSLRAVHANEPLVQRARAAAPGFRSRYDRTMTDEVRAAVAALV